MLKGQDVVVNKGHLAAPFTRNGGESQRPCFMEPVETRNSKHLQDHQVNHESYLGPNPVPFSIPDAAAPKGHVVGGPLQRECFVPLTRGFPPVLESQIGLDSASLASLVRPAYAQHKSWDPLQVKGISPFLPPLRWSGFGVPPKLSPGPGLPSPTEG